MGGHRLVGHRGYCEGLEDARHTVLVLRGEVANYLHESCLSRQYLAGSVGAPMDWVQIGLKNLCISVNESVDKKPLFLDAKNLCKLPFRSFFRCF